MSMPRSRALAITTTAIVAVLAGAIQPASSQNLFEMLFGGGRRDQPPAAEPAPVQRAAPPRIRGPQYYTYKTDSLVAVDFAALAPKAADHAAVPGAVDMAPVGSTASAPAGDDAAQPAADEPAAATATTPPAAEPDSTATAADEEEAGEAIGGEGAANTAPDAATSAADGAQADAETAPETAEILTREQVAALQGATLMAEKEAAEAIVAHYNADPRLIWTTDGAPNERARQAIRIMGEADGHGLDPHDYAVVVPAEDDAAGMAAFEMELSARLLRYVRDARSGRVDPNRISGYHDFAPETLDAAAVLAEARETSDLAAFLDGQHPQTAHYASLRTELEVLRASPENDIVIAEKTVIKPGQTNPEFPKILTLIDRRADVAFRAEHGAVLAANLGSQTYEQALVPVVKAAQTLAGVGSDGVIGPRTIQALAGESKAARIEKVLAALERLRWLPTDLSDRYVFINVPAFKASYIEGGEERLAMRTVVGTVSTQTYFFQDEIDYVEFHPYWGVPKSILVNKYLPKLYADPSYLDRAGFEVTDSRGRQIPSSAIDWGAYGANIPFDVRQRPGRSNALGELKIMFPNDHAIYMHDTPDKHLFDRDNRALSNGCVRLADPRGMAAAVLGWDRARLDGRLEQPHSRETLPAKVPVYVAYFTAWPGSAGEVEYFNDAYSRDDKLRAALDKVEALRAPGA